MSSPSSPSRGFVIWFFQGGLAGLAVFSVLLMIGIFTGSDIRKWIWGVTPLFLAGGLVGMGIRAAIRKS